MYVDLIHMMVSMHVSAMHDDQLRMLNVQFLCASQQFHAMCTAGIVALVGLYVLSNFLIKITTFYGIAVKSASSSCICISSV